MKSVRTGTEVELITVTIVSSKHLSGEVGDSVITQPTSRRVPKNDVIYVEGESSTFAGKLRRRNTRAIVEYTDAYRSRRLRTHVGPVGSL